MTLEEELMQKIGGIEPADSRGTEKCLARWNRLAKPLYALGLFEGIVAKIAGIDGDLAIDKKCVAVMCADNGVVEENVTQAGSDVTAIIAGMMAAKEASVCRMAEIAGAEVFPFDIGMFAEADGVPQIKTMRGTSNLAKTRAMTREAAAAAVNAGIDTVKALKEKGFNLIAAGEMGIGNTTTAGALAAVFLGRGAREVTGRGAGLSAEALERKIGVIENALKLHNPQKNDPIDALSKVGGLDVAGMCGLFLGGALHKVPIIIDGFISSVAALIAVKLNKNAAGYMIASHKSKEAGARSVLDALGLSAPIDAGMALGEGTGAVALMPLLDMAVNLYKKMAVFEDADIVSYKPL